MTAAPLTEVLDISRKMLVHADNREWEAIAELQEQRVVLLEDLQITAADSETWRELADLNQQLVAKLQEQRSEEVSSAAQEQRQHKIASTYRKT